MPKNRNPKAPAKDHPNQCVICSAPLYKSTLYCSRCGRIVTSRHRDQPKRRSALQKAWSSAKQAFLCHFSHLPIEEINRDSPFAIEFDHITPIPESDLVATVAFINQLKGDLTADEFKAAFYELVKHWNGTRFNKAAIAFEYWSRVAPKVKLPAKEPKHPLGVPLPKECVVCGRKPHKGSPYCDRCRRFIGMQSDNSV
jgi:predicted nucleic acid-binding Zn ribbon protein